MLVVFGHADRLRPGLPLGRNEHLFTGSRACVDDAPECAGSLGMKHRLTVRTGAGAGN
jgi:hypothetical protein